MILCQCSTDNVERLLVTGNGGNTATFDLFDSESGQDLTLSPQTFTSSTEAFINDNSDSLGVPGDTDTGRLFHDPWTCRRECTSCFVYRTPSTKILFNPYPANVENMVIS